MSSTSSTNSRISPSSSIQLPFWIHFFSGGIAGSISAVVTCPLELVKTRFQSSHYFTETAAWSLGKNPLKSVIGNISSTFGTMRSIYLTEGLLSLWKGVGATLVGVIPSRAIFFSSYQTCKGYLTQNLFDGQENSTVHVLSAISAGIVTTTATNPIWLIKTRIQLQSHPKIYKNSIDCLRQIVRNEGPLVLYQGMTASYLGCIEGTIQWVLYEKLKKILQKKPTNDMSSSGHGSLHVTFISAAVSKVVACSLTYPHEVLRTRLRQGSLGKASHSQKPYKGLVSTIRRIYIEGGIAPFYGGMTAHLLRVVPNAAIMFFCYELLLHTFSNQLGYTTKLIERELDDSIPPSD